LNVVATTTLVGDVVRAVGGEAVDLLVLLPPGAEPHSYQLSPGDVAGLEQADLVFVNGFDLEEALVPTLTAAIAAEKLVSISDGVEPIALAEDEHEGGHEHDLDPHTWTDPNNVMVWTENIAAALAAADPGHSAGYRSRAAAYKQELVALDAWIRQQVLAIPEGNRKLVTDHAVFGYFAQRYGLEQVGAVIPGFSALAEPSAQELAALEDAIRALGVGAIFVGNTANPGLAARVAKDTNTRLLFVYSDSLSDADGPAGSYLAFMRHNVGVFVDGLR
jgi:ABC-type Zn uptake system ZnuABC Zn-binding protein ZnuA